MRASALPPTAPTTLVIVLGASAWPKSPGFQASRAFMYAAQGFRDYLLDPRGFGLPAANLLDLFDALSSASDQLEQLGSFFEQRTQALKAANQAVRDVVVYFVGHGGFAGSSADFYLLPRRANASSLRASGMAIDALAEVLREKARQTRRYLFLDCCFAAAAFRSFQGGPDQTAITKTLNAFHVQSRSSGFPGKGTVLLCSSDQKSPSLLLPDESCTMFSFALLDVLRSGDLHRSSLLSLRDLKELAEDRLAALPEKNAPRPGLHSPDQSEGDVADVPFFPNPSVSEERRRAEQDERTRPAMEKRLQNIAEQPSPMPGQPFPPTVSPHVAIPPQRSIVLPPLPISRRPKRLRTPLVVALILLILLLLGGGSLGIYGAATGNWLWSANASLHNWHTQHSGTAQYLGAVAWAGTQFVVVGSNTILTSPDGRTWTPHPTPHLTSPVTQSSVDLNAVVWSGKQFIAAGQGGTLLTSPDGSTWTPQYVSQAKFVDLSAVAWAGTQFVVVGTRGTILTSPDGSTWTSQEAGLSQELLGVAWSDTLLVVVGQRGTILTSPDGSTWTPQHSSISQDLYAVVWSGKQFIAVGQRGTILTSPDGSTWTSRHSGTSQNLWGVTWAGTQFVAVGEHDTILTSPEGSTWTPRSSGISQDFGGVAWSGKQIVIVGANGTILTSS